VSSRNLAVIMDPIESIKPHKDSSLAMLLEAQNRGWKIHYGQLNDIGLRDGCNRMSDCQHASVRG
jgi:glutathione synthase